MSCVFKVIFALIIPLNSLVLNNYFSNVTVSSYDESKKKAKKVLKWLKMRVINSGKGLN